jgi:glutathione S-transferase
MALWFYSSHQTPALTAAATLPVLYSFRRCPYAIRARLALAHAGLACELREINLRNKPQALLDASPKGTVPVLVLQDGKVIDQSLEVMHALRDNDPDGWLQPTHGSLEDMLALIERNDGFFKQALDRCKYPERHDAEAVNQAQADALTWLSALNDQLEETGYLFGLNPSLADMALRPLCASTRASTKRSGTSSPGLICSIGCSAGSTRPCLPKSWKPIRAGCQARLELRLSATD